MNAERLHAIALAVREDLEKTAVPSLLGQLAAALNATVQNPADSGAQQQVSSFREQLAEHLAASRVNEFSDAWWLALKELGIDDLLGANLAERIEEIFRRNEITPASAATEFQEISTRLNEVVGILEHVITGLRGFGIGAEELEPGEFEVGFLIPREAVDNELEQLGMELTKLDALLLPFTELAGEGRPDLEVRSIASSDFQIFLAALPGLAYTMAKAIESLLSSYEKIRNIRAKASSLQDDDDVPEDVVKELVKHANERMSLDVDRLAEQLVKEAARGIPAERKHELRVEVRRSLVQLAHRIDEGYSIEVRAFTPPDEEEEEVEGVAEKEVEVARAISAKQPRMRTMNLTGRPILELPEGDAPPKKRKTTRKRPSAKAKKPKPEAA